MADLTAKGIIKLIKPTEAVGTQGFEKRIMVLTTDEQYPQTIEFEFHQGNVTKLDAFLPGQTVNVWFNLRGREWVNPQGETKVFNTLQGWNIAHVAGQPATAPPQAQAATPARKYVHTATDATEAGYKQAGWTEDVLVQHGKGHFVQAAPPVAAPPQAPPASYPLAVPPQAAPAQAGVPDPDLPF